MQGKEMGREERGGEGRGGEGRGGEGRGGNMLRKCYSLKLKLKIPIKLFLIKLY
jgi:hypothetical protein